MTNRRTALLALACLMAMAAPAAAGQRLIEMATRGDASTVERPLRERVDANAADADGTTALHWAVWADNLPIADALFRVGASVSATNAFGVTPIVIAAEHGNAAIVRRLDASADMNTAGGAGETVLMASVRGGHRLRRSRSSRLPDLQADFGQLQGGRHLQFPVDTRSRTCSRRC